jgi:hypothetical protein
VPPPDRTIDTSTCPASRSPAQSIRPLTPADTFPTLDSDSSRGPCSSATLNDAIRMIDLAFAQFNKAYTKEVTQVDCTGDGAKFQSDLATSETKLKPALGKQATRIRGGSQTLAQTLNARVDSLVKDLKSNTTQSSTDLVRADQSGAYADVLSYVHDEVTKGDSSLK